MLSSTRGHRAAAVALAASLVLSACSADDEPEAAPAEGQEPTDDLQVVATTSILGDVVDNLLGDDGDVEVLMQPGTDPHGYEPSARDAAMLRDADLVVANGLQLEESLLSALEAAAEDGVRIFEVAGHLDPIAFDGAGPHDHGNDENDDHAHEEDDGHGHDEDDGPGHGQQDPHVWHDPIRMADAVHLIAAELADISEVVDADEWEARAQRYGQEILAVHEEIEQLLADVPDEHRKLITNHDAFGYLAARYDFEVIGTVVPGATTDAETNPGEFAELIATLETAQVPAIFSENVESDRLSEQLASEVLDRSDLEVEVIELFSDALGEPGSGGETYLGMLRTNAERIADGLG